MSCSKEKVGMFVAILVGAVLAFLLVFGAYKLVQGSHESTSQAQQANDEFLWLTLGIPWFSQ